MRRCNGKITLTIQRQRVIAKLRQAKMARIKLSTVAYASIREREVINVCMCSENEITG